MPYLCYPIFVCWSQTQTGSELSPSPRTLTVLRQPATSWRNLGQKFRGWGIHLHFPLHSICTADLPTPSVATISHNHDNYTHTTPSVRTHTRPPNYITTSAASRAIPTSFHNTLVTFSLHRDPSSSHNIHTQKLFRRRSTTNK